MKILLQNRQKVVKIDIKRLKRSASLVLKDLGSQKSELELSIVILDDEGIAELNKRFRGKSGPTDVLSFPMDNKEFGGIIPHHLLGDIVISAEKAYAQAMERDIPLEDELNILLIHGILHLLGFDHKEDEEARLMKKEEKRLLNLLKKGCTSNNGIL